MKTKLIWVFLLVFAMSVGAVAQGMASEPEVWYDDCLVGELLRTDDVGSRVYRVTLSACAANIDGRPAKAEDYVCVILLTEPAAYVTHISDTEFVLALEFGVAPPEGLISVSPKSLGLRVFTDEDGAYLVGDVKAATEMLEDMLHFEVVELFNPKIPLSDGSDDAVAPAEDAKPAPAKK